eukprot:scaffold8391_cov67-Cyclotella_meneghiniana.AAC.4
MDITVWSRHFGIIKIILSQHLNNAQVYQNITHEIQAKKAELMHRWYSFLNTHSRFLPDNVVKFFKRAESVYGFDKIAR